MPANELIRRAPAGQCLRGREDMLLAVIESTAAPVFSVDSEGCYTSFNRSHAEIMKALYGAEIEPGAPLTGYMTVEADRATAWCNIQRALDGEQFIVEAESGDDALSRPYFEISHNPLRDESGRVTGVAVFAKDITERKRAEEALRESQELFSLFMRHSPVYTYIKAVTPTESRVLQASDNYQQMIGIPGRDMVGKTMAELWPAEFAAKITADDWAVVSVGKVLELEEEFDGRSYTTIKFPIIQGDKNVLAGYTVDITERRQAEEALRESEESLRALFDTMTSGCAIYEVRNDGSSGGDYIVKDFNASSLAIEGKTKEEVLGKSLLELRPTIDEYGLIPVFQKVWQTGEPAFFPSSLYVDENYTNWYENHVFKLPAGEIVALYDDITERKRTEEALRIKDWTIESATNAIVTSDMEGNLNYVNPAFLKLWGYGSPAEVLGKPAVGFWQMGEKAAEVMEAVRTKEGWIGELVAQAKDSALFDVHVAASMVVNDAGQPVCTQVSFLDMTEHKALEAQLRQAQKMESVGRLAGGVAHDFNNMLGVILGHAEMALEQVDPAQPLHADLTEIRQAAQRSADLTRQLLAFARKQTISPIVLDLNETVAGMLTMLKRLIGEDIDLAWQPQADLWPVKVDPSQIDQILANLCINARDAIADVGKMTIETGNSTLDEAYCAHHPGFAPGEYVRLAVSDDGCGMEKETLSHLFEPFFTTKGVGQGTGLGLATVYGIVKQNNGFIDVYSEPGEGTTFTIYLPRHAAKAEQIRKEGPLAPAARGQETILLVEDEPAILKMTTRMLEHQGYTVLAASTPGEAIRLAREHAGEIHLLMTDVVMPEMNGRNLAKNLLSLYPNLGRLFMSGYTADVIAHQGVLDEGVYFIQKPFSMKDLAAQVREALDST